MDPKIIALRKAAALERIENGLALLAVEFKSEPGLADQAAQFQRTSADPHLADMLRFEQVAGLLECLLRAARRKGGRA